MARVLTKKSTVAAKVPLATDLEIGELAVNTADAKLYTKHSDNTVKQLGIATNDSRLTDAREWTASTVTQAEAEAGTATTRRAWTAQRVFQAIAAWWAASAMKTKLDGIATGATANDSDAQLRDRSTHTGTQAISTVSGLQAALDGKLATSARGVANGVASLDANGLIPPMQLPSYVDDVLEYAATSNFPATGETGKIYIAVNGATPENPTKQYRWTGTAYSEITSSPGSTDAVPEGSGNLYFTADRVRSTVLTGLSLASSAAVSATDTLLSAFGKIQAQLHAKLNSADPVASGMYSVSGSVPGLMIAENGNKTLFMVLYNSVFQFQRRSSGFTGAYEGIPFQFNVNAPDLSINISQDGTVSLGYGGSTKFQTTSAGVSITGTFSATSDRKFKSNEQPHDAATAWSRLCALQVKTYRYDLIGKDYTGFIAQEVQQVYPNSVDLVESDDGGHLVLTKDEIIADLVAVVQEQQRRLSRLEEPHDAAK